MPQAKKVESWECKNNSKKDILGKQGLWIKILGTDFYSAQALCFLKEQILLVYLCKGTGGPLSVWSWNTEAPRRLQKKAEYSTGDWKLCGKDGKEGLPKGRATRNCLKARGKKKTEQD